MKPMIGLASEFKGLIDRSIGRSDSPDPSARSSPEQLAYTKEYTKAPVDDRDVAGQGFFTCDTDNYSLQIQEPIPFGLAVSFHRIGDRFLWISTNEAGVLVLQEAEHQLMRAFVACDSPSVVANTIVQTTGITHDQAWDRVASLIGRAAAAGFIRGIRGYNDCTVPAPMQYARFHLTRACQLTCIHCYASATPRIDRSMEMPTEEWADLTRAFAANGGRLVLFTGGEPLLHPGCLDLLHLAKSLKLKVVLFSNGILIPASARAIAGHVDKVQVSLDGPDEITNDAIRGKGVFHRVMDAINALLAVGVSTQIGITLMQRNLEAWRREAAAFRERFAPHVDIAVSYGVTPHGRATTMRGVDLTVTRGIVSALRSSRETTPGPVISRMRSGCGYGEQLVVGADGMVYPCHLLDAAICHVHDHSLARLGAILANLSREVNVDRMEVCRECDIRYLCGGTCRVVNATKGGSRLATTCTAVQQHAKYCTLVEHF
jgi:radical SAM protein with 4Fe4S-binding SPASM domain